MRTTVLPAINNGIVCRLAGVPGRLARRGHQDQSGSISILSVFAVLLLTMLLGMLMNVGRQVDGKIRMQSAADAAAYSGGLVLARGLNSIAFTNHLLSEVFAMNAWMREAHDRHAVSFVPTILAAWKSQAPLFGQSGFPKFDGLVASIPSKADAEQALVTSFTEWAAAVADGPPGNPNAGALPLMEAILRDNMISEYQHAIAVNIFGMAQQAAMTAAGQNSQPDYGRGPMCGVLWQASTGLPLGGGDMRDWIVDDPSRDPGLVPGSQAQRGVFAENFLEEWNAKVLTFFDYGAKMSAFGRLWRALSKGQLQGLLKQYPNTNLPMVMKPAAEIRPGAMSPDLYEAAMNETYTFVAVVYWKKVPELLPSLYHSPIATDALAYAEVRVFVPTSRLVWQEVPSPSNTVPLGGPPGYSWPDDPTGPSPRQQSSGKPGRQIVWTAWDLGNQHWTCQIVPATHQMVPAILQKSPPVSVSGIYPPNLGNTTSQDLEQISYH
jgi:hypothetical protein